MIPSIFAVAQSADFEGGYLNIHGVHNSLKVASIPATVTLQLVLHLFISDEEEMLQKTAVVRIVDDAGSQVISHDLTVGAGGNWVSGGFPMTFTCSRTGIHTFEFCVGGEAISSFPFNVFIHNPNDLIGQ